MLSFYQFWDKLNGKPYENGVPPPVPYNFVDYVKNMTPSPVNGTEQNSTYELTPLTPEDMCRYGADDVAAEYERMHKGKNPLALGKEMSDEELAKFYGKGW